MNQIPEVEEVDISFEPRNEDPNSTLKLGPYEGAWTVARHRKKFLRHFKRKLAKTRQ